MISTLSSLMIKFGIERVYGKGHHKSVYQKALEKLEGYRDKMAQYDYYNSLFDGRNSFSKTDTDATFMHMKEDHMRNGQLKPGYNIQAAVEGEYIVGIDVSSERSDVNTLIPFLSKLNDLELFVLKNIICDAGYSHLDFYSKKESAETIARLLDGNEGNEKEDTIKIHSDTKKRHSAYAPDIIWRGYWYEKTAQRNSDTGQSAFRYRCRAFLFNCGAAAQKARLKKFMLRKWQHRQVAPLAIQTPTKGGLCIGCAVLPAQRGNPLRDLP